MPTIKDVVYKILKEKNTPLAEYYQEYREERNEGIKGYKVQQIFWQEYDFWKEELNMLNIDSSLRDNLLYGMYNEIESGDYLAYFEKEVVPVLNKQWSFQ